MDQTASDVNIKYSLMRYIKPYMEAQSVDVTFDTSLADPNLHEVAVTEWIVVKIGAMSRVGMADLAVEFIIATRGDDEGVRQAELSDIIFEMMTDSTMQDGKRRIPFYVKGGNQVGALLVQEFFDGPEMFAPDRTKIKILTCKIRWVAKA